MLGFMDGLSAIYNWLPINAVKQFFSQAQQPDFVRVNLPDIKTTTDFMLKQASRSYAPYALGVVGLGIGLYAFQQFRKSRPNNTSATSQLVAAIKDKNIEVATKLIEAMTIEELNKANTEQITPLVQALRSSQQISKLIVEKFLKHNAAVNTQKPDGKSIFRSKTLGKRLLGLVTAPYRAYQCSDAKRFPGNIHASANKAEILSRKIKDEAAATHSTTIQPYTGNYARAAIQKCATLVDKAQSGACTSFALAVADKLLTLFPHERVEILGHKGGWRGSHVFVVMNHQGEGWKLNDVDAAFKNETLSTSEREQVVDAALVELKDTYIIDPWLASLGWGSGVFDPYEYMDNEPNRHFILNTATYFDSKSEIPEASLKSVNRF